MLGKKKPARKNRLKKKIEQKRQRRKNRLLMCVKLIVLVAVVLVVSVLFNESYKAVTQSDYFGARTISIKGQFKLSKEEVLKQAGIKRGDNLLAVNIRLVRKRLLAHPWIEEAQVARKIPNTIKIVVTEHRPLAVVDLGRKFLINHQGRIFKEDVSKESKELVLVTGVTYEDISLEDDDLTPVMEAVVEVLKRSKSQNSVIAYNEIRKIHVDEVMGVTLFAWKEKRQIKMGFKQFEYKYKRLKQLLPHLRFNRKWRGFHTIDVNNPDRIVVQL